MSLKRLKLIPALFLSFAVAVTLCAIPLSGTADASSVTAQAMKAGKAKAAKKSSLSSARLLVKEANYEFGSSVKPAVKVTYKGKTLKKGRDYTIAYTNNVNAGKATVTVNGIGGFSGKKSKSFKIKARDIARASAQKPSTQVYSGTALTPAIAPVRIGSHTLSPGKDYTVSYSNNRKVGTGTVKIRGKGNFRGAKTLSFKIAGAPIGGCNIVLDQKSYAYTGSEVSPKPTVTYGGKALRKGSDYTLTYSNNLKAGKATVTVTGKGNFAGSKSIDYQINQAETLDLSISSMKSAYTYTGASITPEPKVKYKGKTLDEGSDYTIAYANNVNAGTATMTVTGKGNFAGSKSIDYQINPASLSSVAMKKVGDYTYNASAISPVPSMAFNGKGLSQNDYTITYSNNVNAGTAKVTVAGKGNFRGTKTLSFKIKQAKLSSVNIGKIAQQTYSAHAITPVPSMTFNGKGLSQNDYTLSYSKNLNAGTAKVEVVGRGNFTGKKTLSFKIAKAKIASATVAKIADFNMAGASEIKPKPSVTFNKTALREKTDFTLKYSIDKSKGQGKVTIKGKGNFTGSCSVSFKLINMGDDLARVACRLSYSRTTVCMTRLNWPDDKSGTTQYRAAFAKYFNAAKSNPRDCGRGMMTVIRHSGYDPAFPAAIWSDVDTGKGTIKGTLTKRWKVVGKLKNTTSKSWVTDSMINNFIKKNNIQPGDVFVTRNAQNTERHICMYVGKTIPQEIYKSYLKGRGVKGGDVGKPSSSACFVAAHRTKGEALCIETAGGATATKCDKGRYITVIRCVKPACK